MRLNQYLAAATSLSRRSSDQAIRDGRVGVNHTAAKMGMQVTSGDQVTLDGQDIQLRPAQTVALNKPTGYICSRVRQGKSPTIFELLAPELQHLKPVGRLDKDSSGLLILTTDGQLANHLSHPSSNKWKRYQVMLNRPLAPSDAATLSAGVQLSDGPSQLRLKLMPNYIEVSLQEGRNRQIRRSFAALGYTVKRLHRVSIARITLGNLAVGSTRPVAAAEVKL